MEERERPTWTDLHLATKAQGSKKRDQCLFIKKLADVVRRMRKSLLCNSAKDIDNSVNTCV